jgi:hypothetical protein
MFALATLMTLISQVSGTPYVTGGDSPAGTDCSGLASWVSNVATGRPAFGNRFTTSNEENALLTRGFKHGTQPGSLVIGWNGSHTAVTLPDGTSVSSGEGGGVKFGGAGAYQSQFTNHMYLDVPPEALTPPDGDMTPPDGMSQQPVDIAVDLVTPPGAPPPGVLPPVDVPPPGVFPDTPPPAEILPPADVPPAADQGIPGDPGAPVPPPGMAV